MNGNLVFYLRSCVYNNFQSTSIIDRGGFKTLCGRKGQQILESGKIRLNIHFDFV